jgi:hypothetical protein
MPKQVTANTEGSRKLIRKWLADQERRYMLPVLDEEGRATGETYDTRLERPDQPDPNRFRAHLSYLKNKYGGYEPEPGDAIEDFNPVDPYESSGLGESLGNMLKLGYTQSLTGMVEEGLHKFVGIGDEKVDAFGLIDENKLKAWQPNTAEKIGAGISSFFMPADFATLIAGGGAGRAVAGAAQLGRVGTKVTATALQLGTYEGARGFFEGAYTDDKSAIEEAAKGFGKGAFLGATIGGVGEIAGSLIPRTVKGAGMINSANEAAAEVFTLGTVSPIIEGQTPGFDDYVNAAGFIVGIKTLGALGSLPQKSFSRKRLAEVNKMEKAIESGEEPTKVVTGAMDRAIESNPSLDTDFVKRLREVPDGESVGKLGDFVTGEQARKLYTPEVLETQVKMTSDIPAKAENLDVAGWVGWDKDGVYKIFVHPNHRGEAGFTVLHEAAHLMRRARGRELGSEKAEKSADAMAEHVVKKDLTDKQITALATRQWNKQFESKEVVSAHAPIDGRAVDALKKITPDTKAKPESYVFITAPAEKSAQNALKLFGKGRKGATVGVYETSPGKKSWTVLDVSAPSKAERVELVKKVREEAKKAGVPVYLARRMNNSAVMKAMQAEGLVSKKPVGKYHKVIDTNVKPEATPAKALTEADYKAIAEKHGVSFDGVQEAPKGRPSVGTFTLKDKNFETTLNAYTEAELAQKIATARAAYKAKGGADAFRVLSQDNIKKAESFSKEAGEKIRAYAKKVTPDFLKQFRNRATEIESIELTKENGPLSMDTVYKKWHRRVGSYLEQMRRGGFVQRGKVEQWITGKKSLTEAEGKEIAAAIDRMPGETTIVSPESAQVAREIRKVLESLHKEYAPIWKEAGLTLGHQENYFPRIIKSDIRENMYGDIRALRESLKDAKNHDNIAVQQALAGKDRLKEAVEHIVNSGQSKDLYSALKQLNARIEYEMFPSARFEKHRTLELPSNFYERDARVVIPEYVNAMSKRAAELEVWGNNGAKALDLLEKIRGKNYEEWRTIHKGLRIFTGEFNIEHGLRGKAKTFTDAFIAAEFATKIGMGRGTILNLTQPIISFGQELGIWNSIRGGLDLFDPKIRSFLRESGAVDRYLLEASIGERPGGFAGKIADKMGTISGFTGVNKMLQYWSGSTFWRAAQSWHRLAQGSGKRAEWSRQRLLDFNIDPNKPLMIQQNNLLEAIYRYATDSQLQSNMLRDPLMMNDPRLRAVFVFKRFGVRQMGYIKDTMKRELSRGNVMPLLRLGAAGMVGGEATIWTINKIKSMLSGEEAYRQEDNWQDRFLNNLAFIGSLGMMSDLMEIDSISKGSEAFKFAVTPVGVADAFKGIDTVTKFLEDWEKYGDGWLATKRNAYNIFGFAGSYPRYASARLQTTTQKENRVSRLKGIEKSSIFEALMDGDWKGASNRVQNWNRVHVDNPLTMNDVGVGALKKWVKARAKQYARAKGGTKQEMRAIERERYEKLAQQLANKGSAISRYREGIR